MGDRSDPIAIPGSRIILRSKNLADAEKDYAWAADRVLMRLDADKPCEFDFSIYYDLYQSGLDDPAKIQFAIDTYEGNHIGNCTCYNIDHVRQEAEIGVIIGDRSYWGKGYGSDAVRMLSEFVTGKLGMQRIVLHTLEWNVRARECFERCGFKECGCIVKQGQEFIKMEFCPSATE